MTLYKNVDIRDLESIMKSGVLPMDECENNNWNEGKRSDNDTSVVYLFKPSGEANSFPQYGIALLEIECDAKRNEMSDTDVNRNRYTEYIVPEVRPDEIRKIIVPGIFRDRISVPDGISVTWCEMCADECVGVNEYKQVGSKRLSLFAKTTPLNSTDFNFFRGVDEKRHMIDLYNVSYTW